MPRRSRTYEVARWLGPPTYVCDAGAPLGRVYAEAPIAFRWVNISLFVIH